MRVLITGGGGFLGQKLAQALAAAGTLRGRGIASLTLADLDSPAAVAAGFPVRCAACDVADAEQVSALFAAAPFDAVFHLAAVVSGAAEADFDLGLRVNLMGTLAVFQAVRAQGNAAVVVYASSLAAHGGEEPETLTDGLELNPQTSYGAQKVMGELLLNDMTRRGMMDGRGLRLPAVVIRPGRANAAASGFMSSIFRDTMQGQGSNCPVGREFEIYHSAPRTVTTNLIHAAELDGAAFGFNRCVNLPGRTDTIGDMVAAMTGVFGPEAEARITWHPDPEIQRIVSGWRARVEPDKALRLGFAQDQSFADSVRWFLQDDILPSDA